jgi:hypothetical protein
VTKAAMRGNLARWGNFAELEGSYDEMFLCHVGQPSVELRCLSIT